MKLFFITTTCCMVTLPIWNAVESLILCYISIFLYSWEWKPMANTNIFHKASIPLPELSCSHRLCTVQTTYICQIKALTIRLKKFWFHYSGLLAIQSYRQISEELAESYLIFLILPAISNWFIASISSQQVQLSADLLFKSLLYLLCFSFSLLQFNWMRCKLLFYLTFNLAKNEC